MYFYGRDPAIRDVVASRRDFNVGASEEAAKLSRTRKARVEPSNFWEGRRTDVARLQSCALTQLG
jgi:hypothetical protein